jgi:hypothetical protein
LSAPPALVRLRIPLLHTYVKKPFYLENVPPTIMFEESSKIENA